MAEVWLNENLCSFDEKVRVEKGPQIIELECNDANLDDTVTAPHYRIGARDAYGRVIRPGEAIDPADSKLGVVEKGEKMAVVDWRAKHVPHVWKIYRLDGERFQQIDAKTDRDEALAAARKIAKEMK